MSAGLRLAQRPRGSNRNRPQRGLAADGDGADQGDVEGLFRRFWKTWRSRGALQTAAAAASPADDEGGETWP